MTPVTPSPHGLWSPPPCLRGTGGLLTSPGPGAGTTAMDSARLERMQPVRDSSETLIWLIACLGTGPHPTRPDNPSLAPEARWRVCLPPSLQRGGAATSRLPAEAIPKQACGGWRVKGEGGRSSRHPSELDCQSSWPRRGTARRLRGSEGPPSVAISDQPWAKEISLYRRRYKMRRRDALVPHTTVVRAAREPKISSRHAPQLETDRTETYLARALRRFVLVGKDGGRGDGLR